MDGWMDGWMDGLDPIMNSFLCLRAYFCGWEKNYEGNY
jgi:hypothetical protein